MPWVRANLFKALEHEDRWKPTYSNVEWYDNLESLFSTEVFRTWLANLCAYSIQEMMGINKKGNMFETLSNHNFGPELDNIRDHIWLLCEPQYRKDTIFPCIRRGGNSSIIPKEMIEIAKRVIKYIFNEKNYAQVLLEKIIYKWPYWGQQKNINENTSIFRDQDGNITAKRIWDELIERFEKLLTSSSSLHSTQPLQSQPE